MSPSIASSRHACALSCLWGVKGAFSLDVNGAIKARERSPVTQAAILRSHFAQAADTTLNRYRVLDGTIGGACGAAHPYQRTTLRATADGFDVTPLVTFLSSDPTVAATSSARTDVLEGRSAGSTTISLYSSAPVGESVEVLVTDSSIVSVAALEARVVTDLSWSNGPPPTYTHPANFGVEALVVNSMRMEGHTGLMFTEVRLS